MSSSIADDLTPPPAVYECPYCKRICKSRTWYEAHMDSCAARLRQERRQLEHPEAVAGTAAGNGVDRSPRGETSDLGPSASSLFSNLYSGQRPLHSSNRSSAYSNSPAAPAALSSTKVPAARQESYQLPKGGESWTPFTPSSSPKDDKSDSGAGGPTHSGAARCSGTNGAADLLTPSQNAGPSSRSLSSNTAKALMHSPRTNQQRVPSLSESQFTHGRVPSDGSGSLASGHAGGGVRIESARERARSVRGGSYGGGGDITPELLNGNTTDHRKSGTNNSIPRASGGRNSSSSSPLFAQSVASPVAAFGTSPTSARAVSVGRSSGGGGLRTPRRSDRPSGGNQSRALSFQRGRAVGSGGFGVVYQAILADGSLAAVKELKIDPSNVKMIDREVHTMSNIPPHPNCVRYLGSRYSSHHYYIVMEYISGGSIHSLRKSVGKFRESVFQHYAYMALLGLDHLHKNGIIHRDIKGANVLLTEDGCAKIVDFGCCKDLNEATSTLDGGGTPLWMAPEVCRGEVATEKSDVWAFGCLCLEMTNETGLPWSFPSTMTIQGLAYALACAQQPPPIPADLSTEAQRFLECCLRIDPEERATVEELIEHSFFDQEYSDNSDDDLLSSTGPSARQSAVKRMVDRANRGQLEDGFNEGFSSDGEHSDDSEGAQKTHAVKRVSGTPAEGRSDASPAAKPACGAAKVPTRFGGTSKSPSGPQLNHYVKSVNAGFRLDAVEDSDEDEGEGSKGHGLGLQAGSPRPPLVPSPPKDKINKKSQSAIDEEDEYTSMMTEIISRARDEYTDEERHGLELRRRKAGVESSSDTSSSSSDEMSEDGEWEEHPFDSDSDSSDDEHQRRRRAARKVTKKHDSSPIIPLAPQTRPSATASADVSGPKLSSSVVHHDAITTPRRHHGSGGLLSGQPEDSKKPLPSGPPARGGRIRHTDPRSMDVLESPSADGHPIPREMRARPCGPSSSPSEAAVLPPTVVARRPASQGATPSEGTAPQQPLRVGGPGSSNSPPPKVQARKPLSSAEMNKGDLQWFTAGSGRQERSRGWTTAGKAAQPKDLSMAQREMNDILGWSADPPSSRSGQSGGSGSGTDKSRKAHRKTSQATPGTPKWEQSSYFRSESGAEANWSDSHQNSGKSKSHPRKSK